MIDDNKKFEILFQKSESLEKKRQRIFLILILLPILYFLLKTSVIEEINLSIFTIKQINIILLFYPSLYSILFFYTIILTEHNSKVIDELNFIVTNEKDAFKQYQKESWLKIIQPMNALGNILGSIRAGGLIGCLGAFIVFIPLLLFVYLFPIISLVYFLHSNSTFLNTGLHYLALGNLLFTIWTSVAMIIYSKSAK